MEELGLELLFERRTEAKVDVTNILKDFAYLKKKLYLRAGVGGSVGMKCTHSCRHACTS